MVGYCVRCKNQREVLNAVEKTNRRGSKYTVGQCKVCRTNMAIFMAKPK